MDIIRRGRNGEREFSLDFRKWTTLLVEDVTKRLEEIVSFMEQIEHEILSLFFSLHISRLTVPLLSIQGDRGRFVVATHESTMEMVSPVLYRFYGIAVSILARKSEDNGWKESI